MWRALNFFFIGLCCINFLFAQAKKKVACIGDSVTKGFGLSNEDSYPSQLQELLGSAFEVGNFGRNGATLLANGHNPYLKSKELQDALGFQPDIVIIALGLNDTDPRNWPNYQIDFQKDYQQLLNLFRTQNPKTAFYICIMSPIFSGHPRFLSGTRDWFQQIQQKIREVAASNKVTLVDNHQILSSRIDLFDDYIHPSAEGAQLIAQQLAQYIKPNHIPLQLAETYNSHMVLQRDRVNKIKGRASSGEIIKLYFKDQEWKGQADVLGNWEIELPAQKAGGPFDIRVSTGTEEVYLKDILFGDVYLASGQSNMAFPMKDAKDAQQLIEKLKNNKYIRLYHNQVITETTNQAWDTNSLNQINKLQYFHGKWELPSVQSLANFSAIALAFGADIQSEMNIPIGLVQLAVGGSNTESWISRSDLEKDNLLASYIHTWRRSDFIQDFCRTRAAENLKNSSIKNQRHPYDPSYNFEAGVRKWLDHQFKAVLWYQGESNAHNKELHELLFPKLIQSWRGAFQQELPFYFVQLSSINRPSWPAFRESQNKLASILPKTYMVVSSDLGHPQDVHPKDKIPIGIRLSNLVKKHSYHLRNQADAPQLQKLTKRGKNTWVLDFRNCKQFQTKNGEEIKGFQVMDTNGNVAAVQQIKVKKSTLEISLPEGSQRIYYAYEPYTNANLENEDSVPVSTFSIDLKNTSN